MNCSNPFTKNGMAFGCGQCLPCRINRKRTWTHRLLLEASQYADNCFVTLTYSEDKLPRGATLVPAHSRDFLKRHRSRMEPERFRYYLVGEYGDETQRPHYHAALFGHPPCQWGGSRYSKSRNSCCVVCDTLAASWRHGHVYVGNLTPESAAYICGYVTKKLTSEKDPRLNGRHPEFSRMSNRPGIGAGVMDDVASSLLEYPELLAQVGDVPSGLCHGRSTYPLGRYLKRRLRQRVGLPPDAPSHTLLLAKAKMHLLQERVEKDLQAKIGFKASVLYASLGKRAQINARYKIFNSRKTL